MSEFLFRRGDLVTWVRCRKRVCLARKNCHATQATSPADTMLPKAAIVALKGLLAWSNFISALDTGIKAHLDNSLLTRDDLVF